MGAWGPGIFSCDLACDVRASYREKIGEGLSSEEATESLCQDFPECLNDPDERPTFWMALAAAQWQCGRLISKVKYYAIEVIDAGGDIHLFQSPKHCRQRAAALAKLRTRLLQPQRAPTRIREVYHYRTDWNLGDVVGYRLQSGKWVLLRVVDISEQKKSRIPIVELCDWTGQEFPPTSEIERLPARENKYFDLWVQDGKPEVRYSGPSRRMAIYALSPREIPTDRFRVVATHTRLTPVNPTHDLGTMYFGGWKRLDDFLKSDFDIE